MYNILCTKNLGYIGEQKHQRSLLQWSLHSSGGVNKVGGWVGESRRSTQQEILKEGVKQTNKYVNYRVCWKVVGPKRRNSNR